MFKYFLIAKQLKVTLEYCLFWFNTTDDNWCKVDADVKTVSSIYQSYGQRLRHVIRTKYL